MTHDFMAPQIMVSNYVLKITYAHARVAINRVKKKVSFEIQISCKLLN